MTILQDVDIKYFDADGNLQTRATVPVCEGSVVHYELQQSHYCKLSFKTAFAIDLHLGDFIDTSFGRFELVDKYKPEYDGTEYSYQPQFDAYYRKWKNKTCKYIPTAGASETSFTLTASIAVHGRVVLKNLARLGKLSKTYFFSPDYVPPSVTQDETSASGVTYSDTDYIVSIDSTVDAAKARNVSYQNVSILDALSNIAEAFECEWWVTENIIHFGECRLGQDSDISFKLGANVASMTNSTSTAEYATRLYSFGATKNLPDTYKQDADEDITKDGVVQKRLMLPTNAELEKYATSSAEAKAVVSKIRTQLNENGFVLSDNGYLQVGNIGEDEAVEATLTNDDDYPRNIIKINSDPEVYESTVDNEETSTEGDTITRYFYRLSDLTLVDEDGEELGAVEFVSSYILSGKTLHLIFQSGSLNGMDFEAEFNPHGEPEYLTDDNGDYILDSNGNKKINPAAQCFEVVANEDYGRFLPDKVLKPKKGDTFVLYNWDSTKMGDGVLIYAASADLLLDTIEYLKKSKIDANTYTCTMLNDHIFNSGNPIFYDLGTQVTIVNPAYFSDGKRLSRIIGYEVKLDIPWDDVQFIVGEEPSYSKIGELSKDISALTYNGGSSSGTGGTGGGGGSSVSIVKRNDRTAFSDTNVMSSLRSLAEFVRLTGAQIIQGFKTFKDGINVLDKLQIGSNYSIDENGNAILADVTTSRIHDAGSTEEDRVIAGAEGYDIYMGTDGKSHMYIDYLNVRNRAVFSALEIRKVSYSGGVLLLSQAGSTIARVDEIKSADGTTVVAYKCWATADDGTTATQNWWKAGMMALSQTFNVKAGHYANTGNRYWWRLVVDAGQETLEDGKLYDYFTVSNVEKFQGSAANVPHTDTDEETGEKTTAWTSLAERMLEQDGYETDTDGTNITGRYFYGMDTDSDAPTVGDVAVQAGDQVRWTARGNVVKITTSTEDGAEENAPAMVMYHGMGAPYTTGVKDASGEETVSPYQWKTITRLDSPGKTYVNSDNFVWFSGSLDNTIEPIATWLSIMPSESTIVRHADGTTTPEEITLTLRKYRGNATTVVTEGVEWSASWTDTDGAEHKDVSLPNGVLTEAGSLSKMDGTVEVKATYDGMEASVGIPVLKDAEGEDAVQVDVLTDKGTTLRPTLTETTLTAYVTKGGEDVSDQLAPHCYSWTRVSEDTASDTTWNQLHSGVGRSITVTKAEVFRQSLFECTVDTTSLYGD